MDQDDADVQGTQNGHIQQDICEVFVGNNRAVHFDDERFLPELGDVLQDAAQVSQFHFGFIAFSEVISKRFRAGFNLFLERTRGVAFQEKHGAPQLLFKTVFSDPMHRSFCSGMPTEMRIQSGN